MSNSYRQILRSSSIIGGGSVINILVVLLRTKVAAVLLGPSGVGLIGLLQSLMATAAAISALGFGNVGTRQIAEASGRDDTQAMAAARRALFWGTLVLATTGGVLFWSSRRMLATWVLGDPSKAGAVGWLALGVALTVAAGSQGALLTGMRRIGDLVRASVAGTLISTALGVAAIWIWGERGVLAFVLMAPLASFVLGHWYVAKLPRVGGQATSLRVLVPQWKALVRLGTAFMIAGVVVSGGNLIVRTLVQRELGADALGQFQAAWMIAMTYVGFVLGSMGPDFYPRLTATIGEHAAANRLVNEQSEVVLLLSGPVLVAMLGLAPWVIELLFSAKFGDAVGVLRWQILGDVLKVASWPLGFVILAAGDGRAFMLTELSVIAIFVGLTWVGLPLIGIQATGVAYLGMYVLHLPVVYWLARRRTGFSWQRRVSMQLAVLGAISLVVFLAATWSIWIGAVLGSIASMALAVQGLARLGHMANLGGTLGSMARLSRRAMMKAGIWHD